MKFLYGLILPTGTIGKDPISWSDEELLGRIPIMFADTATAEYENITNFRHIWNSWQLTGRDFLYAYQVALDYFATLPIGTCGCSPDDGRFHELSDDEKDAACSLQIGPQDTRVSFVGLPEILSRNLDWLNLAQDARLHRVNVAIKDYLVTYLPVNYRTALVELVENKTFYKYIEFGLKGILEGDPEGLFDYILGTVGTSFAGVGLLQKTWTPISGLTMLQFTTLLMSILKDGEYIYKTSTIDIIGANFGTNNTVLKISVRVASLGNVQLLNPLTNIIDGITMVDGDRILLKNQTNPAENGIYTWDSIKLVRSPDANMVPKISSGMFTFVEVGTQASSGWVLSTPDPIILETTPLTFVQFSEDHTGILITSITAEALLSLSLSNSMQVGFYNITDRADKGIIIKAVSSSQLENSGVGTFLNADYHTGTANGNYSGVFGQTGIAVGQKLDVWESTSGILNYTNPVYSIRYTLVGLTDFTDGETIQHPFFTGTLLDHNSLILTINDFVSSASQPYTGTITGLTSGATATIIFFKQVLYTVGDILKGAISGVNGTVISDNGSSVTLKNITGVFLDLENIYGKSSSTTVNGSIAYIFNPAVGDIVIWGGLHYQKILAGIESIKPIVSSLYTVLPKNVTNVGYLVESNFVIFDLQSNKILERSDNNSNVVPYINLDTFQFGNINVKGNKITTYARLNCINQKGLILGNNVLNNVIVNVDESHIGQITYNTFAGSSVILISQLVINNILNSSYVSPEEDFELDGSLSYNNLKITPGYSNFPAFLHVDDLDIYIDNTLSIPFNLNYVGIFTLGFNPLYPITTYDIHHIVKLPVTHDVIFRSDIGKIGIFTSTDITLAIADDYISNNILDVISGSADGNEELIIRKAGIFNQKIKYISNAATTGDKFYLFDNPVASTVWNINHNQNKYPSVTIVDGSNNVIYGNILYVNVNNLTITFATAISGKAYIN